MTEDEKWDAVVSNNEAYNGRFFYCVKSTGIFCRPSCRSRLPKRENICFADTKEEAMRNGFRPCKRCRSDLVSYRPQKDTAAELRRLVDEYWQQSVTMRSEIRELGLSEQRLSDIFREEYGLSPAEYLAEKKLDYAKEKLVHSDMKIVDLAFELEFGSLSSFYKFFKSKTGMTPAAWRKGGGRG